jgi:hypothetical protein
LAPVNVNLDGDNTGCALFITLLVKRDNRRKHNSLQWYLRSFVDSYHPVYLFSTDCGTVFNKDCLLELIVELDENKQVVAVCGRQKLMSKQEQRTQESWLSFATFLRYCTLKQPIFLDTLHRFVQCFDFEAFSACFAACRAMFGMLQVIPGA